MGAPAGMAARQASTGLVTFLGLEQGGKAAIGQRQLLGGALLHHHAVLNDGNPVHDAQRGQTVRNDDGGAVPQQLTERLLHALFGLHVHG